MISYPKFRHITLENVNGIVVATLPAEPVLDDDPMDSLFHELHDMFIPLTRDSAVEALVVTGTGDLLLKRQLPETNKLMTDASLEVRALRMLHAQQLVHQIVTFPKPFVAAVNGASSEHFLYADAIIAADSATFGDDHHVMDGVASGDGNTLVWPFLVGMARARQTLLRGRRFTAAEAFELGFVQAVVPREQVREAGIAAAREMADLPRVPFMSTKLALNNWFRFAGLISMDLATAYQAAGMGDPNWVRAHT